MSSVSVNSLIEKSPGQTKKRQGNQQQEQQQTKPQGQNSDQPLQPLQPSQPPPPAPNIGYTSRLPPLPQPVRYSSSMSALQQMPSQTATLSLLSAASSGMQPSSTTSTSSTIPAAPVATSSQSQEATTTIPSTSSTNPILALLGPNISSFPYSEQAFIEAMKLRVEQERTKQDYYRVETANKNLAIVQTALKAQIPTHLIPLMCIGQMPDLPEEQAQIMAQAFPNLGAQKQSLPYGYPQEQPPQPQLQLGQKRSLSQTGYSEQSQATTPTQYSRPQRSSSASGVIQSDSYNASPIPPMNYRFGSGTAAPPTSYTRRPLSPAKIGAAAVANLATPTSPYRGYPSNPFQSTSTASAAAASRRSQFRGYGHQRHYSMPAESPSLGPGEPPSLQPTQSRGGSQSSIDLGAIESHSRKYSGSQNNQSPMSGASTLQVKPIPAQPLHKQSRSALPPSQESMTSFQHIIQFHHWKPQGPQASNSGLTKGVNSNIQGLHKRHKSMSSGNEEREPLLPAPDIEQSTTTNTISSIPEQTVSGSSTTTTQTTNSRLGDDIDPDSSMDTTVNEESELKIIPEDVNPPSSALGHSRQQSNVGRYPHDILSPNK